MHIVTHVIEPRAKEEILAAGGCIKDLAQVVDQHPHCDLSLVILPDHASVSVKPDGTYEIALLTDGRLVVFNATVALDARQTCLAVVGTYHINALRDLDLLNQAEATTDE